MLGTEKFMWVSSNFKPLTLELGVKSGDSLDYLTNRRQYWCYRKMQYPSIYVLHVHFIYT